MLNTRTNRRAALAGLTAASWAMATTSAAHAALDTPGDVITVMQFKAKNAAAIPELKKRMAAMRDFQRQKASPIENALFENRNPAASPHFVGVSRWKSLKDWEALWNNDEFQKLVRSITEVGELSPGTFTAVK